MDIKQTPPGVTACQARHKAAAGVYEKWNSTAGDVYVGDHGVDTELGRLLRNHRVAMIALRSSLGVGLWLGSGTSPTSGGLAGIFLGYLLAESLIWCISHSIGKLANPAAAFALGWPSWLSYCITIANELQAANNSI
ncbi:hypothetical protein DL764_008372 [Monosporascus ibericus]|uniref:Amino acid permease/ SLC12A domain-containing protein n=1 Tax=Monosporascus ibericus TaxID=155417 RepID=A0A4Q4SXN9_9PEZI|nr:hypothetical protein DL764_008372 [Monosporascus ibericus]